ncbi:MULTISPECIES: DUF4232 domain-containing protein [unclassified Micromonospora]|uniref:DUF4232 domain-containing protein n=1 Tax=unclassified Micromonospora TaxID=2617518 RepID=UPI00158FDF28|nr:DUF4232 domain-containing protein [Verrucosispora sp. NA02020]QKW16538.1 DUF4232 domain-containing protein [Verrucosispora sp. NA02020]
MPDTTTRRGDGGRAYRRPRLVALLTAFALLAGCAPTDASGNVPGDGPTEQADPATSPTTAGPDAPEVCPESGVRIRYLGVSAAMGLRAMGVELVNCGDRPYKLRGYPALRLFDGEGAPITVRVVEGAAGIASGFDDPPRPLVLAPGATAGAAVIWRNLVDDPTVVATDAARVEIAAAKGQPGQELDMEGPIDLGNTDRIGVSAWKKRTGPTPTPTESADDGVDAALSW